MQAILALLNKELTLEWRQKHTFGSMLLYVLATVFIVFSVLKNISPNVWIAIYWIIVLFASANATTRSFYQESGNRQLFYYQLSHSLNFIFSKLLYNFIILLVVSTLTWLAFSFFSNPIVKDIPLFILTIFLGCTAFATIYTFISAIANKTPNGASMMAILSFPLFIPVLLTLLKLSAQACRLMQDTGYWKDILILLSIDGMLIGVMIFLFPFVWRD
jgi:heme exporter protein B